MADQSLINTKHTRVKFSVYSSCSSCLLLLYTGPAMLYFISEQIPRNEFNIVEFT